MKQTVDPRMDMRHLGSPVTLQAIDDRSRYLREQGGDPEVVRGVLDYYVTLRLWAKAILN